MTNFFECEIKIKIIFLENANLTPHLFRLFSFLYQILALSLSFALSLSLSLSNTKTFFYGSFSSYCEWHVIIVFFSFPSLSTIMTRNNLLSGWLRCPVFIYHPLKRGRELGNIHQWRHANFEIFESPPSTLCNAKLGIFIDRPTKVTAFPLLWSQFY